MLPRLAAVLAIMACPVGASAYPSAALGGETGNAAKGSSLNDEPEETEVFAHPSSPEDEPEEAEVFAHPSSPEDEPEEAEGPVDTGKSPIEDDGEVSQSISSSPTELLDLGLGDSEFDIDFDQIDIEDDLALLAAEDLVVSASRRLQRIEESPSAITVITREQILASGYDSLVDLMRLVPGADVHHLTQGQAAVGMRSRSTWAGDRLLVLADGRDVALPFFGAPLWENMPFDVEAIERIEIIRGPGSTLYGANALQGVVNIVTRRPTDSGHDVELSTSFAGAMTTSADLRSHGRIGSWGYFTSAGWSRAAPYALPEQVASESFRGRLFFDWDERENIDLRIEAGFAHFAGDFISFVGDGKAWALWPYLLGRLSLFGTEILVALDWLDSGVDLDLNLVLPDELDGPPLATAPLIDLPTRSAEITAHRSFDLFEGNSLMLGGSARAIHHMEGGLITCPDVPFSEFDPDECVAEDVLETRIGFFLQNEWFLRDELLLNVGARLDHNSLTSQPGISPRAAVAYNLRPNRTIRLAYGRAYRKPTFSETDLGAALVRDPSTPAELFHRLQHIFANVGNRDLINEYVDSLELGVRGRFFDERLTITVDGFASVFHHAIIAYARGLAIEQGIGGVPRIPEDAEITFENRPDDLRSYGMEISVSGHPHPWLELSGSYSLDRLYFPETDPDSKERTWHLHDGWEPDHRLIGSARLNVDRIRASLDAIWFSRYTTATRNPYSVLAPEVIRTVGANTLLNGHLSYHFNLGDSRSMDIGIMFINMLDQPYREAGAYDEDGWALGGGEIISRHGRLFVRGRL